MAGRKLRKILGLAVIGGAAAALLQRLRGGPAPQFSNHPTVAGGPGFREPTASASPGPSPTSASPATASADATAVAGPTANGGGVAWVEPVDGTCPDGFPIKAKLASGIFHRPGGFSYERTKPDRCYPTADAAEADGLRPAKR